MPVLETTDGAPDRDADKAEHRKHADEVLERPEHKVKPKDEPRNDTAQD
jgi:hypothetical protein